MKPENAAYSILIVSHDANWSAHAVELFSGYCRTTAVDTTCVPDALQVVRSPMITLIDCDTPGLDPAHFMAELRRRVPHCAVILTTRHGRLRDAIRLMRAGASDYLVMPLSDGKLIEAIDEALAHRHPLAVNAAAMDQRQSQTTTALVGNDHAMQRVHDLIDAVAPSPTTILLSGESGTGKSRIAHAIHEASPRANKPIITFACGAVPESLLESELFGHVKGAFTGADQDRKGRLATAEGGTLFLDEINSASPTAQVKLLRVLQEKLYEPVGSAEARSCDVRFILASNRDLEKLVEEGSFREDLFYRINVVNIAVPPLRDRRGDIAPLAEHFIELYGQQLGRHRRLTSQALSLLERYNWPGNVRELENAIERAVVLSRQVSISKDDLPERVSEFNGKHRDKATPSIHTPDTLPSGFIKVPALEDGWQPTSLDDALLEPERQIIQQALAANDFNRQETARQLGIDRTTLYKKIKRLGVDLPQ